MVKKYTLLWLVMTVFSIMGCSVKPLINNYFKLSAYSKKSLTHHASPHSIFVNLPDAVAGYQNGDMLYVQKPFELSHFVHSAWVEEPAQMLLPLLVQSLQRSGFFHVVASSPSAEVAEYRMDTQLIELHQNFLTKPSFLSFIAKVVLVQSKDYHVVASRIFNYKIPCPADTPYGGVVAANQATEHFTADVTSFIINQVKKASHT